MPSIATAVAPAASALSELHQHLLKWFYKPDLEALDIVLSAVVAHHKVDADTAWLFVLGPSGSGKTECLITSCYGMTPGYCVLSHITPHTFISHASGKSSGLLARVGKEALFLFKDFTSLLSLRDEYRVQIASQLRELYDGRWSYQTGMGEATEWQGKITVIAAATPALEKAWAIKRELGERFLTIRWPRVGKREMALKATAQKGHEKEIRETTQKLGTAAIQAAVKKPLPELSEELIDQIAGLSEATAIGRGTVYREPNSRVINDLPSMEEPTRIQKALCLLTSAYASLTNTEPSIKVAERLAHDTMPSGRAAVIYALKDGASAGLGELCRMTGIPKGSMDWIKEELQSLGVVQIDTLANSELDIKLTEDYLSLFQSSTNH